MDIEASKIALVKLILNIDNDSFIQKVTDFINNEKADFWNDLSASEQAEIQKGIDQLNKGSRVPFNKVLKDLS